MAILVGCSKCNSFYSLKNKVCPTCNLSLAKSKRYKVNVKKQNGRRITRTIDGSLSLARTVESKLKVEIVEKKLLHIQRAPHMQDVFEKYLPYAKAHKKSWKEDEQRYNRHIKEYLGGKKLDTIFAKDIQKVLNEMMGQTNNRGKPYSAQSIKHVFNIMRRLFNWAIQMDIYEGANPCKKVKPPKVNNQVTECLSKEEVDRLLKTVQIWGNRRAALIIHFALLTGLRQGEILGLRFADIDRNGGFLKLEDPKGKPTVLPLGDDALKIIEEAEKLLPTPDCEWVFPNKWGNRRVSFNKIWNNIKDKAKLPKNFRFHGLRHTYASYMASSGEVDLYTLQKLLNHQSPQMTQRYAHLLDEALRKSANIAGKVLNGSNNEESIVG
ncbi:tyrosine-type recombinase/integrase [Desulfogranum marinum]|uniref:tyrosine-type recombinase/integrase n=1 Tax=Desulfogranum marinum TaxID=453220 RepID=UPI0029C8C0CA|nr:tyrosine-type recombinase/integrase [Desulfogranum marinum]